MMHRFIQLIQNCWSYSFFYRPAVTTDGNTLFWYQGTKPFRMIYGTHYSAQKTKAMSKLCRPAGKIIRNLLFCVWDPGKFAIKDEAQESHLLCHLQNCIPEEQLRGDLYARWSKSSLFSLLIGGFKEKIKLYYYWLVPVVHRHTGSQKSYTAHRFFFFLKFIKEGLLVTTVSRRS
jgi:hypothetical protein